MISGDIVFIRRVEEWWDYPMVKKRHHVYDTRSVVLKCKVVDVREKEFKATLFENNGFERDGETYLFPKGELLSNQNYTDFESLGKWSISRDSSNSHLRNSEKQST